MPKIKCKTAGCSHEIVYLPGKTYLIFGTSSIGGELQQKQDGTGNRKAHETEKVILTLKCIDDHVNNYEFDVTPIP